MQGQLFAKVPLLPYWVAGWTVTQAPKGLSTSSSVPAFVPKSISWLGLPKADPDVPTIAGPCKQSRVATMLRRAAAIPGETLQILANFRDMMPGIDDREYELSY
jgi:hypothetical protein